MYEMLSLSPKGHLHITTFREENGDQQALPNRQIAKAFAAGQPEGLLALATARHTDSWPSALSYWREFTEGYISALCHLPPTSSKNPEPISLSKEALEKFALSVPPMPGAEYCTQNALEYIWNDFDAWVRREIQRLDEGVNGSITHHLPL